MYQFILVIHMFVCLCIVGLVLVQQGKGASMGAAFGSGASQTVFGSRGSGSFLLRVTVAFVAIFFSTSIVLNYMATKASKQEHVVVLPADGSNANAPVTPNNIPTSTGSTNLPQQ